MRWKITGQILGLLLIVLPVMYASLLVFGVLLFGRWGNFSGAEGLLSNQTGQMTIDFEQYLNLPGWTVLGRSAATGRAA